MKQPSFSELLASLPQGHPHLVAMFELLASAARENILQCVAIQSLPKGQVVVEEGIESDELGYVLSGALGMVKSMPDGRLHIIGLLMANDMYGRLFDGPVRFRIEALTDVTLLCFKREPFEAVLREAPEVERMFLVSVLDELDAAREWVLLLNGKKVAERVASFLLFLMRRSLPPGNGGLPSSVKVHLPIRRTDLSHCLSIRPESLSRALHRLAREGLIRMGNNDSFLITDLRGLAQAAGQELVLPDRTPSPRGRGG